MSVENMTNEELKQELRKREAKEQMDKLVTGLNGYITSVSEIEAIDEAIVLAKSLVYQYERANRVLNPSTGKRGRKSQK